VVSGYKAHTVDEREDLWFLWKNMRFYQHSNAQWTHLRRRAKTWLFHTIHSISTTTAMCDGYRKDQQ